MPLTVRYIPGKVFNVGDVVTEEDLNALANPTIELEGTIATQTLTDGAVTEPKLATGAVSTRTLADAAVTVEKLADGGVIEIKLGNGAVSTRTLAARSVTVDKLAQSIANNFGSDGTLRVLNPMSDILAAKFLK